MSKSSADDHMYGRFQQRQEAYGFCATLDEKLNQRIASRPIEENKEFWKVVLRTMGSSLNIIKEELDEDY